MQQQLAAESVFIIAREVMTTLRLFTANRALKTLYVGCLDRRRFDFIWLWFETLAVTH